MTENRGSTVYVSRKAFMQSSRIQETILNLMLVRIGPFNYSNTLIKMYFFFLLYFAKKTLGSLK